MADEDKNLLGIKFGNDKWKYAHATTVEYPAEHVRKNEGGNPVFSTSTSSDSLYGKPDVDIWEEGIVKGITSTLTKGWDNGWMKTTWEISEKEFRQNAPPVPIFSPNAVMGGVLGATSAVGARMVMRQPLYARVHAFALQVTAGYWIGYQWNKWCSKKNMSEYKHAVDFAQRHSDIIHKQEPTKFGSPQILEHWSLAEARLG